MHGVLLWLFAINLGVVFGAGLYESRIVVPLWKSELPGSLLSPDSGRQFWAWTSTIPLTLLTVASLVVAWRSQQPWWIGAAVATLAERISTFGYFIPTILRMQRAATPSTTLTTRMAMWERMNYLRLALTLCGWLAAMKALIVTV